MSLRSRRIAAQQEAKRLYREGQITREEKRARLKQVNSYLERRARQKNQELRGKIVEAEIRQQAEVEARRDVNIRQGFVSIDPRVQIQSSKQKAEVAAEQIALRQAVPVSNILARNIPKTQKVQIIRKDLNKSSDLPYSSKSTGEANERISTREIRSNNSSVSNLLQTDPPISEKETKYIPGRASKEVIKDFIISPIKGVAKVQFAENYPKQLRPIVSVVGFQGRPLLEIPKQAEGTKLANFTRSQLSSNNLLTDPDVLKAGEAALFLGSPVLVQKIAGVTIIGKEGLQLVRTPSLYQAEKTLTTAALLYGPELISKSKKLAPELLRKTELKASQLKFDFKLKREGITFAEYQQRAATESLAKLEAESPFLVKKRPEIIRPQYPERTLIDIQIEGGRPKVSVERVPWVEVLRNKKGSFRGFTRQRTELILEPAAEVTASYRPRTKVSRYTRYLESRSPRIAVPELVSDIAAKPKLGFAPLFSFSTRSNLDLGNRSGIDLSTDSLISLKPVPDYKPIDLGDIITPAKPATKPKTSYKPKQVYTPIVPTVPVFPDVPSYPTPKPPRRPGITPPDLFDTPGTPFDLGFKIKKRSRKNRSSKNILLARRGRYVPSLTGIAFEIKAPKGFSTKGTFTGLEAVRPLL